MPMGRKLVNKLLLIGWDGADWKIINRLLDTGRMPALERLVNGGVKGNLATLDPPLSPMLWTSIATGMTADRHGILGFTQPDPERQRVRPVLSSSRKVKAIWNILMQNDYLTNVIGWWPSHPAEPVNGVYVSNFFQRINHPLERPAPLAPGTVHPAELAKPFAKLRVHPEELTPVHLLPFVPTATEIDQAQDRRLLALARIIAETASLHSVATWVMEHSPWDFMAVYYDALDHFSHTFMKFHPPRRPDIPEDLFRHYQGVVDGAYLFHDMMLDRLMQLAGPDTTVMLVSDHGFHSDHLRPSRIPREPAGPAHEHRPYGIFCLRGPNLKEDELVFGASLLDITPTILTLFGLPLGRDMPGKPLLQALREPLRPEFIPSWEEVPGECGMAPGTERDDPWAEQQALEQLVALGYIEPPTGDARQQVERAVREANFHLARVYLSTRREELALPLLEQLYADFPQEARYGLRLVQCYQTLGHAVDALELLRAIRGRASRPSPVMDLLEGQLLLDQNQPEAAAALLCQAEQAADQPPGVFQHLGEAYLRLRRWSDAETAFTRALTHDPDNATAYHGLGLAQLRQGRPRPAAENLLSAIGLLYHLPAAHYHLAEALAALGQYAQAAEALEVCVAQAPGMRRAHLLAAELYEHQLQQPAKAQAHRRFVELRIRMIADQRRHITARREPLKEDSLQPQTATAGQRPAETQSRLPPDNPSRNTISDPVSNRQLRSRKKTPAANPASSADIIVVTGLPRSGTSLMMQMLAGGGMPILTDYLRRADDNNPYGYFEYEKVKGLPRDNSWLAEADGKAVKIVIPLLRFLSRDHRYRIIFMERDLADIITSQERMLTALGHGPAGRPESLLHAFRRQVDRARDQIGKAANTAVLCVNFAAVLADPPGQAKAINAFLGGHLDEAGMAAAVRPR